MKLDHEQYYRAISARDARFDGRFFTAVRTTGVYCRPICPARTPRSDNVTFFASPAAAEEAGYRPCSRCRPEAAPGSLAWQGSSATVARAHRLIQEGFLSESSVAELAERLGIGPRHLHRLFMEHLGAGPKAIALSQQVHLARLLLDQTPLPIGELAFVAGFSSIRRFNAAFRSVYQRPPSEFPRAKVGDACSFHVGHRAKAEDGSAFHVVGRVMADDGASRPFELKLAYRKPFDWAQICSFLEPRAIPGVECFEAGCYARTIRFGETSGVLRDRHLPAKGALTLQIPLPMARSAGRIVARVRRLFDLNADVYTIGKQLGDDSLLAPLVEARPGLRVPGAWDGFELAARAILGQQVSVKAATTLSGRLARAFGEPLESCDSTSLEHENLADFPSNHVSFGHPSLTHLFPTPERIAAADMSGLGITGGRVKAIQTLARAFDSGTLKLDGAIEPERWASDFVQLPGIGAWTAQYVAMRALGEPDAFPSGDLGLKKAIARRGEVLSERELFKRAENWRPWRAYAAMHLWTDLASRE